MVDWRNRVAKQAQNPIARLISVPIENDFDPQTGANEVGSRAARQFLLMKQLNGKF
jgi:hypothetical protein